MSALEQAREVLAAVTDPAATPLPWFREGHGDAYNATRSRLILVTGAAEEVEEDQVNADLIVTVVNAAPALAATLLAVDALHQPEKGCEGPDCDCRRCRECMAITGWPCPTRALLDTINDQPTEVPALPLHRTEAGYPRCSTCDGGGCPDCTDPA